MEASCQKYECLRQAAGGPERRDQKLLGASEGYQRTYTSRSHPQEPETQHLKLETFHTFAAYDNCDAQKED